MHHGILYQDRAAEAALQISQLRKRRESIAAALEALRAAVETLTGKAPDLPKVLAYLSEPTGNQVEQRALEVWIDQQNVTLPLVRENLRRAVRIPEVVAAVVTAYNLARNQSEDPARYWSEKSRKFEAVPVTKEEEEGIRGRNARYIFSERVGHLFEFAKSLADLISFANLSGARNFTPARMNDTLPWLHYLVEFERRTNARGDEVFTYHVKEFLFLKKEADFRAFDEE